MSDKAKTIVILTPAFPSDELDSVWVPSKQLFVKKLRENFPLLQIIVLTFNYPCHNREYSWHGARVISFNGLHAKKFGRLLVWIRVWKKLIKIKNNYSIQGIFTFWCGECTLVGKYFARWNRIRQFCWISGLDAKGDNKLVKWIRPRENELVAMSIFLQNEFFKNHHLKPQHIVPIGIDPSEFSGQTVEKDIDILGVGNLIPFKQYDVLIRIVRELSITFPGIKAAICGGGAERPRLEKLIRELGLENNITLLGILPHSEVLQWMKRTKVFLHPSSYEGFGAVCLEALYAGAYVISFCDPMEIKIDRWQIVKTEEEMCAKTFETLKHYDGKNDPVLLYSMEESVRSVMQLYQL